MTGIRTHVYAIDPGTSSSALVIVDSGTRTIVGRATELNDVIIAMLRSDCYPKTDNVLVVEQIESMGMAVGREVFETVWWAGRFHQVWRGPRARVTRRDVKLHLCGTARAKDQNIRQAILDRYGGPDAKGTKKAPGPLYGIHAHEYAALAVALTFIDLQLGGVRHAPSSRTEEAEAR